MLDGKYRFALCPEISNDEFDQGDLKAAGSEVLYLKRLSMGQLQLDETLEPGMFRPLTGSEINLLKSWN